jgi:hypothetical protein
VRQQLEDKYGENIYDLQSQYFEVTDQRGFLRQHPELKKFWDEKRGLDKQAEQMFMQFGSKLPQGQGAQFREDFTPQSGVQETLFGALQPTEPVPPWVEISQGIPEWLQADIASYWSQGRQLSKRAESELDYLAKSGGYYDRKDLLRILGLSLNQLGQGQP